MQVVAPKYRIQTGGTLKAMSTWWLCAMSLLLGLPFLILARDGKPPNKHPSASTRIELLKVGFQPYVQKYRSDAEFFKSPSFFDDYNPRVAFLDENTLVAFYVRTDKPTDSTDGKIHRNNKLILDAFFIDWPSQTLRKHEKWETSPRRAISTLFDSQSLIFPLSDQMFLVHAGDQLLLYSLNGEGLRKRALPVVNTSGESWNVLVATGGKTFVLRHMDQGQADNEWLDAESFEVKARNTDNFGLATASEHSVAVWQLREVVLHNIGQDPKVICASNACQHSSQAVFLSDDQILLQTQTGFRILSTDGRILWLKENQNITTNGLLGVEYSLTGNRFALRFTSSRKISFDGFELPSENNLLVYDRDMRNAVFSIHLEKGSCCTYALSPEGRYLALLDRTSLLVYDLKHDSQNRKSSPNQ